MAARRPEFITFTGADDSTDVGDMIRLSALYPIEWGILFNPKRQGKVPRFPGSAAVKGFTGCGLRLAAHLCGSHAEAAMTARPLDLPVEIAAFGRIQINHRAPDPVRIAAFQESVGIRCIAQTRSSEFPALSVIDWLFDRSGGRGATPASWPSYPGRWVGFAGGMRPDTVLSIIETIAADGPYWIDMESGVRTGDRFDIALCHAVCAAVHGR